MLEVERPQIGEADIMPVCACADLLPFDKDQVHVVIGYEHSSPWCGSRYTSLLVELLHPVYSHTVINVFVMINLFQEHSAKWKVDGNVRCFLSTATLV